jgi:SAM-dependent methyltransferase
MSKVRPAHPTAEIDKLEYDWWNSHASTVEAVWALPDVLRDACRTGYLKRAAKFLSGDSSEAVNVVELGCGSGWVGRILVRLGNLRIVGIDNSIEQIRLAQMEADQAGVTKVCSYTCADLSDCVNIAQAEGILIHAFMHHFSTEELVSFLRTLARFPTGTRVFIYEPVYLNPVDKPIRGLGRLARILQSCVSNFSVAILKGCEPYKDSLLEQKLNVLLEMAAANDWVLSPKETVFSEDELKDALSEVMDINNQYLCNFNSFLVAQQAALYTKPSIHAEFARKAVPFARIVDELLYASGAIRCQPHYVFMGYECSIR